MKACKTCGSEIQGGACTECGRAVENPEECRECHSEIEGGACSECGLEAEEE